MSGSSRLSILLKFKYKVKSSCSHRSDRTPKKADDNYSKKQKKIQIDILVILFRLYYINS